MRLRSGPFDPCEKFLVRSFFFGKAGFIRVHIGTLPSGGRFFFGFRQAFRPMKGGTIAVKALLQLFFPLSFPLKAAAFFPVRKAGGQDLLFQLFPRLAVALTQAYDLPAQIGFRTLRGG